MNFGERILIARAAREAGRILHMATRVPRGMRCQTCYKTAYEHRDHVHKPYPTCPFGDCDEFVSRAA